MDCAYYSSCKYHHHQDGGDGDRAVVIVDDDLSSSSSVRVSAFRISKGTVRREKSEAEEEDGATFIGSTTLEAVWAVTGCWTTNYVFHNKYCSILFRCRCTWPWAGGADACNVHHATGPKCPWCNVKHTALAWLAPAITGEFTVALMLITYAFVRIAQLDSSYRPSFFSLKPSGAAILMFILWGGFMGVVFFLGTDYPCFLWIEDDATECGFKISERVKRPIDGFYVPHEATQEMPK